MAILFIYVSRECIFSVTSIWEIWPIFLTTTSSGSAWEGLRLAGARAPWTLIAWSVLLWALNCLGRRCRILSLHMNLFANLGGLINIAISSLYLLYTIVWVWPVNANITGHKKLQIFYALWSCQWWCDGRCYCFLAVTNTDTLRMKDHLNGL